MKDTNIQITQEEGAESEFEEGEIPDFETASSAAEMPARTKFIWSLHNLECDKDLAKKKGTTIVTDNSPGYVGRGKRKYGSPPPESFFGSKIYTDRNEVLNKDAYDNSFNMSNYISRFHVTYGSVQDIMTKIGATLGRNSSCYYGKGKRSFDSKYPFNINNGRRFFRALREDSPVLKNIRSNTFKRKKTLESNSDSEGDVSESIIRAKSRNSLRGHSKRKKKRRQKRREPRDKSICQKMKTESIKRCKALDINGKYYPEYIKTSFEAKQFANERLSKEISVSEEKFSEKTELYGVPEANKTNSVLTQTSESLPVNSSNTSPSYQCNVVNEKDHSPSRNWNISVGEGDEVTRQDSVDSSDKNIGDDEDDGADDTDDDDDDDDVKLIKLRLLALTSNKKKVPMPSSDSLTERENIKGVAIHQEISCSPKSEIVSSALRDKGSVGDDGYNKSVQENTSVAMNVVEHLSSDNDVDRYELLLRAEALKTALLRKHQHRIKKNEKNSVPKCSANSKPTTENENFGKNEETSLIIVVNDNEEELRCSSTLPDVKEKNNTESVAVCGENNLNVTKSEINYRPESLPGVESSLDCKISDSSQGTFTNEVESGHNSYQNDIKLNSDAKFHQDSVQNKGKDYVTNVLRSVKDSNGSDLKCNVECDKDIGGHDGYSREKPELLLSGINSKRTTKDPIVNVTLAESSSNSKLSAHRSLVVSDIQVPMENNQISKRSSTEKCTDFVYSTTSVPCSTELERIIVHLGSESSDEEGISHLNMDSKSSQVLKTEVKSVSATALTDLQKGTITSKEKMKSLLPKRKDTKKTGNSEKVPSTPEAVYSHLAPSQRQEYIRLKQKIAERERLQKMKNVAVSSVSQGVNSEISRFSVKNHNQEVSGQSFERQINPEETETKKKCLTINRSVCNAKEKGTNEEVTKLSEKNDNRVNKNIYIRKNSRSCLLNQGLIKKVNDKKLEKEAHVKQIPACADSKKGSFKNSSSKICNNSHNKESSIAEKKKILNQNRIHLERLKTLWKNIKIEKIVEQKYERELKRLKVQQSFFEIKLNQQRIKIKTLADESKQIYETFQSNNKGSDMFGKKKKISVKEKVNQKGISDITTSQETKENYSNNNPVEVGKNELSELRSSEGSSLEKRILIEGEKPAETEAKKDIEKSNEDVIPSAKFHGGDLKEYYSPLEPLTNRFELPSSCKVDPNAIMCQYDLLGRCNDEECAYQHLRI